jgi:hypothetical protein
MFQTCVSNQKIQRNIVGFLNCFLSAIIRNIKIQHAFDIIKFSKSIQPNKCTHKNLYNENIYLNVSYIF